MSEATVSRLQTTDFELNPSDSQRLIALCGQFNEHLKYLEQRLGVEINCRGNRFRVIGEAGNAGATEAIIKQLYQLSERYERLSSEQVHLAIQENQASKPDEGETSSKADASPYTEIKLKTRRGLIKPRGANQQKYLENVLTHDVNFGVGPAGTGKTYLAVAAAVDALERNEVRRIILTRPAVEAGERLGFLPGDLAQKVDPYLRPLYDALYEMLGFEKVAKLLERNVIEIAPLAYMRGRTLNEAFVILDESQNTTKEQMKMLLTRTGFGSKVVITGDITQVDLPKGVYSGLRHAIDVLSDNPHVSFTFFQSKDVVRHHVVQAIVEAYERYESDEK